MEQSEESGLNWGPSCGPDDISDPCLQKGRGCPPSTSHARGPALVVSSLSPVGGPPGWVSWGTGSAGPLACLASASLSVSLPPAQNLLWLPATFRANLPGPLLTLHSLLRALVQIPASNSKHFPEFQIHRSSCPWGIPTWKTPRPSDSTKSSRTSILPTSCFLGPKSPHSSQWQRHTLDRHPSEREGFGWCSVRCREPVPWQ